jgi:hypothetical protein
LKNIGRTKRGASKAKSSRSKMEEEGMSKIVGGWCYLNNCSKAQCPSDWDYGRLGFAQFICGGTTLPSDMQGPNDSMQGNESGV